MLRQAQHERGVLGLVLCGLVVLILAVWVRLAFAPLVGPLVNPDSEGYVLAGWDLAHGSGPDLGLRRTPGYGVFIAGSFLLLGERLQSILTAQHGFGVVNALLAFLLGRAALGLGAGVLIGLLTALSAPLLLYEHYLMTETLSTTALLIACLVLWRAIHSGSAWWALGAGLAAGLAALCRPALLVLLPLGLLGLALGLRPNPRSALVCCALFTLGASLFILPWMAKNATLYGTFSLAGTGRHLQFRLIRSDDGFSFARPPGETWPEPPDRAAARSVLMEQAARHDRSSSYQRFREELGLSEAESNRLQTDLALEAIGSRPLYYLQGTLGIFNSVFVGQPINLRREGEDLDEVDWDRRIRHLIAPPPARGDVRAGQQWLSIWDPARFAYFVPICFALGVVAAAATPGRRAILLLAAMAVTPQLLGAAMAGYALRFRYPFDPLILLVGVFGVLWAIELARHAVRWSRHRSGAGADASVLGVAR